MSEYIEREAARKLICGFCADCDGTTDLCEYRDIQVDAIPAADVRPVVTCADCKHNNACLTQAFVEDASRVPFDRNTFFCADGKRDDDA